MLEWDFYIAVFYLYLVNIIKAQNVELKNKIEKINKLQSQLIQSEKLTAIGTLANAVAHQIRNPLNNIKFFYLPLIRDLKYKNISRILKVN